MSRESDRPGRRAAPEVLIAVIAESCIIAIGQIGPAPNPWLYLVVPLAAIGLWRIVSIAAMFVRISGISMAPISADSNRGVRFSIVIRTGVLPVLDAKLKIAGFKAIPDSSSDHAFADRQRKADGLRGSCLTVNDGAQSKRERETFTIASGDEVVVDLAHWRENGGLWILISEREFDSEVRSGRRPKARLPKGKYECHLRLIGATTVLASLVVRFVLTDGGIAAVESVPNL